MYGILVNQRTLVPIYVPAVSSLSLDKHAHQLSIKKNNMKILIYLFQWGNSYPQMSTKTTTFPLSSLYVRNPFESYRKNPALIPCI